MQTKPIYKSVPTMRDYEEYKKAEQYTQGWNEQAIEEINKVFAPALANYIIIALTEGATVSEKALEQQSSDDKVIITMNKGTLKYSGQGYVVYNKDWFRKHFATEVEIMTGYDGYIKQPNSDDCVSRKFMYELGATCIATRDKNGTLIALGTIENLPPVTPTHETCKDCENWDKEHHFCFMLDCYTGTDTYCTNFEKRGSEE